MTRAVFGALAAVLLLAGLGAAESIERFPRPEFDTGYTIPTPTTPHPPVSMGEYVDLAALAAAMALAAWLGLKRRSRNGIVALSLACLFYFGFWRGGCICPVGAVQNMTLAVFDHAYAAPIFVIGFFTLPLVTALLFGRVFCAGVCPLGAIQDVVAVRPIRVPLWLENGLRMLAYVYLALAVLLAANGAGFIVCRYDPFVSIFRMSGFASMVWVGVAFLVVGIVIARPYCRYLCPYGVILSWLSRLSRWHVSITPDECVKCRLCENACPFDAIVKPTPERPVEGRGRGVRRLAFLIAIAPVVIGLWAAAGWFGGGPLSAFHKTVQTARDVERHRLHLDDEPTFEAQAFEASLEGTEQLYTEAAAIRSNFKSMGGILGALVGIAFAVKLVLLSVRRTRSDYVADRGWCLSCGRCFMYCPKEHLRLGQRGENEK